MIRFPALAVVLALAGPAAAQPPADNADVLAAARAFDEAQQKGDGTALERLLAPDFLIVRGSGRVGNRQDFIAGFTRPGAKLDPFTISDRLFLRISADAAIVGGEARISGIEDGQRFAEHIRYADTFVRRDGRWMAVFTQVTGLGSEAPTPAKSRKAAP